MDQTNDLDAPVKDHAKSVPSEQSSHDAPAISDYALIGDCRSAALVSSEGSIDWLCLPNFSGPSIFARLLDPHGGHFSLRPIEPFTATRRYIDNTAVLETTFETTDGAARIIDCFPILDGIEPMCPLREVLRIVEGLRGTVSFRASVDPRPDYARLRPKPKCRGALGWSYTWRNEILHVQTDVGLTEQDRALGADFTVDAGNRCYFSLSYSQGEPAVIPPLDENADRCVARTVDFWRDWSAQVTYEGPYFKDVVRSAITLKLLNFAPSGAMIAAPTTSLPEELGGERNWDYRYCWLRDAGLTMQAMVGIGIKHEARCFLDWMLHATRLTWPKLQVMYDLYGRTNLKEYELPNLSGYRESRPVRVGNGAYTQKQLDVYGEVILSADTFNADGGEIDKAGAKMLAGLGKVVCDTWQEADSGIWEVRGPLRQFTFSKVMCWTALNCLLALHERGAVPLGNAAANYERDRDAIAKVIEERGFNSALNAYTAELDGDQVDASILLMPCVGYKTADDPRMTSTYSLICERLSTDGLLLRYEHDSDGLQGREGAFGICSFWAVDQLAQRGELDRAEKEFEKLLSFGNDVGLFAEEIDTETGEALGNFPQAFTHVGLINAAISLEKARRGTRRGAPVK